MTAILVEQNQMISQLSDIKKLCELHQNFVTHVVRMLPHPGSV